MGAGLVLAPNALHICNRLGLLEAVVAASWPLTEALVAEVGGRPLSTIDATALARRYGYGMRVISRGTLQRLLLEALPAGAVHTGKKVVGLTPFREQTQVAFADGEAVRSGFVLGADGIHSAVRQAAMGPRPLRYSGQTCWRAVVAHALPPAQHHTSVEYWGRAPGLRVGVVPMGAGEVYLYLTAAAAAGQTDTPGTLPAELQRLTREFAPEVRALLRACDERCLYRADLFDMPTLATWSAGPVALLGDAAHATTPNLGQGACQALEDAYTIAACLAAHQAPEAAFTQYQALRKAKADYTVHLSRQVGQVVNLPGWLKPVLFKVMRVIPPSVSEKQFSRIYDMSYLAEHTTATPFS